MSFRSLALSAWLLLPAVAAAQTGLIQPNQLSAVAKGWAAEGDVAPYRLLGMPDFRGERPTLGVVYTPLVRLALEIHSAMRDGLNLDRTRQGRPRSGCRVAE